MKTPVFAVKHDLDVIALIEIFFVSDLKRVLYRLEHDFGLNFLLDA
jgi:hypothetical protein